MGKLIIFVSTQISQYSCMMFFAKLLFVFYQDFKIFPCDLSFMQISNSLVHLYILYPLTGPVSPPHVQLSGGLTIYEGRVEISYFDRWGTICDDGFTDREASVVCRMLGHTRYLGLSFTKFCLLISIITVCIL